MMQRMTENGDEDGWEGQEDGWGADEGDDAAPSAASGKAIRRSASRCACGHSMHILSSFFVFIYHPPLRQPSCTRVS
jgi:hypothetical protein